MASRKSARRKGRESVVLEVYSPGRRRKKKASAAMSDTAWELQFWDREAALVIQCNTATGIGLTRAGGGSSLL